MSELNAPFVDNTNRRQSSLVTAVTFDTVIGATATTAYTGVANQFFLIRKVAFINPTGGAITGVLNVGANPWYSASVATLAVDVIEEFGGFLIPPSTNLSATGQNLRIVGWGLRVAGGDTWLL